MTDKGIIYLVATPIGNMEDITLRAVRILNEVDLVAAEDTRVGGKLLSKIGIKKQIVSLHEHNESSRADFLINKAENGLNIAVVSDAGTPVLSDPGYELVKKSIESGIDVVSVPGVSALTTLLPVAGLGVGKFAFFGFLPRKKSSRHEAYQLVKKMNFPVMFFESPRRILSTLEEMIEELGDRAAVLGRELTKMHEEVLRGNLSDIKERLSERERVKGEICFFVEGGDLFRDQEIDIESELILFLEKALQDGGDKPKNLASKFAEIHGLKKNDVYELILKITGKK